MGCLGLLCLIPLGLLLLWYLMNKPDAPVVITTTPAPDILDCQSCIGACGYTKINRCAPMCITSPVGAANCAGACSAANLIANCASCQRFPEVGCAPKPDPQPAPVGPPGACTLFGDPHIMTFDHKRVDFYTPGEYWIVKSATVHIQARYRPTHTTSGLSVTKELAVGGPFLQGHVLRISALDASYDGAPILTTFPSTFSNELVQIQLNSIGETMQEGREGKGLHVAHITAPSGVKIDVNRWNEAGEGSYINVKIMMSAQPGQDGHCGNFNSNAADDDRIQIRARVGKTGVAVGELLFHTKTAVVQVNRPDINDCPAAKLDRAKELCKKKEHKFIPSMFCLVDDCFGGDGFVQED